MSGFAGQKLHLTLFGGSHEPAVGMSLLGFPAGEPVDPEALRRFLARRAPGGAAWASARCETDEPEFLRGLRGGRTDGGEIRALIPNRDVRGADYEKTSAVPRPGHADYTAWLKTGAIPAGGGAFSGRMTAPLCLAGALCLQALERRGVRVSARIAELGGVADEGALNETARPGVFPTLSAARGEEMRSAIAAAKAEGDSLGGIVECAVFGLPAGLGGPLFEGLEGRLAAALFAIPAVKGVEFGLGFGSARLRGSENNDAFRIENGCVVTPTNRCGGLLGGISDGMPLVLRAAFKPTPSIAKPQQSVDLDSMTETTISVAGRHDPCVVPRAVPCVEAAAALVLFDALLAAEAEAEETGGLNALRRELDAVDGELLARFSARMALVDEIAAYKEKNGLAVRDPAREREKFAALAAACPAEHRDAALALFEQILALSRARQEERRGGKGGAE